MKFCSQCGHQLRKQDNYCAECGAKAEQPSSMAEEAAPQLSTDQAEAQAPPPADAEPAAAEAHPASSVPDAARPVDPMFPPRRRMSGPIKVLIACAVVLVVGLIGGYAAGMYVYHPDRVIEAFQEAIEQEDANRLSELLIPASESMGRDEEDVARLAAYYRTHQADLEKAVESLKAQAAEEADADAPLRLVADGKHWFIYDAYRIEVAPYEIVVHTNMADVEVFVDDRPIGIARSDQLSFEAGPFWPGEYEVKAVYNGEFAVLENKQEVELYDDRRAEVTLAIEASYAQIRSEIEDAVVYINGESTGRSVSEFEDGLLGPLLFDGKTTLQAEAEFPWGTFMSEEIVLTPEMENAVLPFLFEEAYLAAREQVMDAVNEFLASWVPAYMTMDISQFTNITEERRSLFASDFQWMMETGQRFTAEIVGSEFDLNSFVLDGGYNGQPYRAEIEVAYVLTNAAWYYEGEEPQLSDMASFIRYELIYEEETGQWIISYFTALDGIDFSNTQAFTYE